MKRTVPLVLLTALVFAACSGDTSSPVDVDLATALDHDLNNSIVEEFNVCKTYVGTPGPAVTVNWSVDRESGTPGLSGSVVLADGECTVVYNYINDANSNNGLETQTVTVSEVPIFGYTTSTVVSSQASIGAPIVVGPETPGNQASGDMLSNPDNGYTVEFINTEIPSVDGRMTGGGSAFRGPLRVTHGFQLRCDATDSRQNLEINWEGNRFHLLDLTDARCTDNPAFDEGQPRAGFDTFDGIGVGRYNGVDGFNVRFQFVDDGEPGTSDIARIQITDGGGITVLSVSNVLDHGNHQAHR